MIILRFMSVLLLSAVCAFSRGGYGAPITIFVQDGTKITMEIVDGDQALDQTPVPKALNEFSVRFPREMLMQRVSGRVRAKFGVDVKGSVTSVVILTTTQKGFEDAVVQARPKFQFFPATRNGVGVEFTVTCDIIFDFEDD
jgi:TonB family protein